LVGTAIAIKELLDDIRCRERMAGGLECDEGQPETTQTVRAFTLFRVNLDGSSTQVTVYGDAAACEVVRVSEQNTAVYFAPSLTTTTTLVSCTRNGGGVIIQLLQTQTQGPPCTSGCTTTRIINTSASADLTTATLCPEVTINGVPTIPPKGADGMCPTGNYSPKTQDDVADKAERHGDKGKAPRLMPELDAGGIGVEHPDPTFNPPAVIPGGRETTTRPDGSTVTRDTEHITSPRPDGYEWQDRVTERVWPPGITPDPPSTPPTSTTPPPTTTTGPSSGPAPDIITCGLPTTPPCKIDEGGTPTAPADDGAAIATGVFETARACIAAPLSCLPTLPTLSWGFAFPTGCSTIPLPAFAPYLTEVDVCQFQGVFHDLMSVVWVMGGLFGAIGLFWRQTLHQG
jgi:hypothetical protein